METQQSRINLGLMLELLPTKWKVRVMELLKFRKRRNGHRIAKKKRTDFDVSERRNLFQSSTQSKLQEDSYSVEGVEVQWNKEQSLNKFDEFPTELSFSIDSGEDDKINVKAETFSFQV